jgi:hypothetical protein
MTKGVRDGKERERAKTISRFLFLFGKARNRMKMNFKVTI